MMKLMKIKIKIRNYDDDINKEGTYKSWISRKTSVGISKPKIASNISEGISKLKITK